MLLACYGSYYIHPWSIKYFDVDKLSINNVLVTTKCFSKHTWLID